MQVHLLFFARLKREMGQANLTLEVPQGTSVKSLATLLKQSYPVKLQGCMVAVNEAYASPEQVLQPGDEIAFLPPVAGGSENEHTVYAEVTSSPLYLQQAADFLVRPAHGAQAYFVGTVRSPNKGKTVCHIDYEGYGPLAEKVMQRAAEHAVTQYGELRAFIQHRLGQLQPGEASILIGVSSPHRRAALEACDFLIEHLKVELPIWKYEADEDGEHWVEGQSGHPTL